MKAKKVYLIRNKDIESLRGLNLITRFLKNLPKMTKYLKRNYIKL